MGRALIIKNADFSAVALDVAKTVDDPDYEYTGNPMGSPVATGEDLVNSAYQNWTLFADFSVISGEFQEGGNVMMFKQRKTGGGGIWLYCSVASSGIVNNQAIIKIGTTTKNTTVGKTGKIGYRRIGGAGYYTVDGINWELVQSNAFPSGSADLLTLGPADANISIKVWHNVDVDISKYF